MSDALDAPRFKPINQAHAIVEVVFFHQFAPEFSDATLRRLSELEFELKDELPKATPIQKLETRLEQTPEGRTSRLTEKPSGIELRRFNANGDVEWLLRITETTIAAHCLDYSTWEQVWPQAQHYLQQASAHLEGESNFLTAVGLKYVDRFLYEGPVSAYDPRLLFAEQSGQLPRQLLTSQPLWHCHTGWFEPLAGIGQDSLNQLNIDTIFVNLAGRRRHVTTIEHTAVVHLTGYDNAASENTADVEPQDDERSVQIMVNLHDHNKRLLQGLLNADMVRRINLGTLP